MSEFAMYGTANILNYLDSFTTGILLRNPENIAMELNPIMKTMLIYGYGLALIIKVAIFLAISTWVYRRFENTREAFIGIRISTFLLAIAVGINLISIFTGGI